MIKFVKTKMLQASALASVGLMSFVSVAEAGGGSVGFSRLSDNMGESATNLPGIVQGLSYLMGLVLGALGVLKIKDHVENPGNAPLKDGAIRLAAGGALLALPFVYEVITQNAQGTTAVDAAGPQQLQGTSFAVTAP